MKNVKNSKVFPFAIAFIFALFSGDVLPACSPYMGLVSINEASKVKQNPTNNNGGDDAADFVEIKLLDNSIPSSVFNDWTLQICENSGTGCNSISVSGFDSSGSPWLTVNGLSVVGRYLNFSVGSDILLTDANGDAIDYVSTGGYNANQPACAFVFDTDAITSSSTRRIKRAPDGTGDWDVPTGNSEPPSEDTTNDDGVPTDAPSLTVDDVVVNAGLTATFTLSLDASYTSDVNVSFQTLNGTALAGTDFIAATGTATIIAGTTTTTVDITTNLGGSGVYYIALSNADNALIIDQVGRGTILPPPVAEWRFDEGQWNGAGGEVVDESGNALSGTAQNGAVTNNVNQAISGDPGTCGYGEFDGTNDYVEVSADPLLDFTTDLTITAWVRPSTVGSVRTIVTKGGSLSMSYRLRLTASDQLEFSWCTSRMPGFCTASQTITSGGIVATNQWTHVAISFQSGNQTLYINGIADGVGNSISTISPNTSALTVGATLVIFVTDNEFTGQIDELRLYDLGLDGALIAQISAQTHICAAAGLDHYRISFDGGASVSDSTGVTCEAISVTIVAHGAGHLEPATPGVGTAISLSTSTNTGFWSSPTSGTLVDTGNGNAVYTFAGNDAVTLQFNHTQAATSPTPVNININAGSLNPNEDGTEDPSVQFFETGFRFIDVLDNPIIANQIAAQQSASYSLQAIRTDTQTGSCIGVFPAGTQMDVELAAECSNPDTCAGLQLAFTNNGSTQSLATNDDNSGVGAASYSTFANLLFGGNSTADFTFTYPDVGAMSVHARYHIVNDDGSPSGDFMLGSSNVFVVSPADLVITTVDDGVTANPGTSASGIGFVAAGNPFRVIAEARNALGNITPNFGNELSPETMTLNLASLSFPIGGNVGSLTNPSSFTATATAGELENTLLLWDEVGTFTVFTSIADGDYLGAGDVVGTTSGNIGRFYPAEFELLASSVTNSCAAGAFSYLADAAVGLSYQIGARNRAGAPTVNYDNNDLLYPAASISVHAENNNDGIDLNSRVSVAAGLWNDGIITVNDSNATLARAIDLAGNIITDGPFATTVVGLRINDIDNANFSGLDFKPSASNNCVLNGDCDSRLLSGMLNLRFGRLRLQDVHGPESAPIPMVWQTEYWNNGGFVLNSDDHCTQLPLTAVNFVGASSTINDLADTIAVDIAGTVSVFDFADPIGMGDCLSPTAIGFCAGHVGRVYGAPNAIITYPIDIDLSGLPFLQGDWNQDGNFNDSSHPRVYVRFQHYRGHDRVIYWRERLQ